HGELRGHEERVAPQQQDQDQDGEAFAHRDSPLSVPAAVEPDASPALPKDVPAVLSGEVSTVLSAEVPAGPAPPASARRPSPRRTTIRSTRCPSSRTTVRVT